MNEQRIEAHRTSKGVRIYRIPLQLFPGLDGYVHLVCALEIRALIDVGSGFGSSNEQLEAGLATIEQKFEEAVRWDDITHILISHGHIDHFGGLPFVQERCRAPVGIHELDRRILIDYEERLSIVAKRLRDFLVDAGVSEVQQEQLMDLYLLNKHLFKSVPIDFTYNQEGMQIGPIEVIHTPGHCPGHVVFLIDDILLSNDHVLKDTSPHQAPERLTLNTGLDHYLVSLEKIKPLSPYVSIVLGGHEGPFENLEKRILEIESLHEERLARVLEISQRPRTLSQISEELFPDVKGYHELLAIEEAGAHVEYLEQRGYLRVVNMDEIRVHKKDPIQYLRREATLFPGIILNSGLAKVRRR
jgi:glyoxylase-like metal-dependent hydrolase (beta-lactamase superfamily II)